MYKGKIEKISKNPNVVVDTLLAESGGVCNFYDFPEVGRGFVFVLPQSPIYTTIVKDIEKNMKENSITFWTKNTEYRLTWEN